MNHLYAHRVADVSIADINSLSIYPLMRDGRTLLLLPTLNEEKALEKLIPEVPAGFDVLVVDSGSSDRTVDVAQDAGFRVLNVKYGRGQGSGIRTGMEYFLERDYDYLVTADCDYTDVLSGLPAAVEYAQNRGFNIVLGIRDFKKQRHILGPVTILVKKIVCFMIRLLTGANVRDILTGVWILDRETVGSIAPELRCVGFEYSFEIFSIAWRKGLKIGEADIDFRKRIGETKLTLTKRIIMVCQGLKYGARILKWKVSGRSQPKTPSSQFSS